MAENDYVAHPDGGIVSKDSLEAPAVKPEVAADQVETKPEAEVETKPEGEEASKAEGEAPEASEEEKDEVSALDASEEKAGEK